MGICLDVRTDAAPFAVEARSKSCYIGTGLLKPVMHARAALNGLDAAFAIPTELHGAFLVAVDQVLAHEWRTAPRGRLHPIRRDAAKAQTLIDPWAVSAVGDEVVVQGPAYVYGVEEKWAACGVVEVEYAHLIHLRDALASVSA